ncbi:UBX domain-containing protein 4 [Nilaparvata lugens]|uniref:UBX domain-containing protein 4 n=1 Tax=Nilaparvata lugens TaxID=108931 RepID=UPI00193DFFB8|nr:UBX domain-containing protein 4 [Nilaparvata lugens]
MPNFEANLNDALEVSKRDDKIVMVIVEGGDEKKISIIKNAVSELNMKKFPNLISTKLPQNSPHYSDFIELYGNLGTPCLAFIENKGIPLKVINGISDPRIMLGCLQETARFCNEKVESIRSRESLKQKPVESAPLIESPKKYEKPVIVESRIIFRMPDHNSKSNTFKLDDTLQTLRNFVDTQMKPPFRYELVTYHPYIQYHNLTSTIRELNLFPSAALMIVPVQSKNAVSLVSGISNVLWFMVNPIWDICSFIVNMFRPTRQNVAPQLPVRSNRQPNPTRRGNNVHTLKDSRERKDDDDDNKTWNGNSTQQM